MNWPTMTRGGASLIAELAREFVEGRSGASPLTIDARAAVELAAVLAHRVAQHEQRTAGEVLAELQGFITGDRHG